MFRDVIAMLAMLAAVTAICLIVIGLIYWLAPPGWYRAPPLRTTQQQRLLVAALSFLKTAEHSADALQIVRAPFPVELPCLCELR
jgi:hypothetical protein